MIYGAAASVSAVSAPNTRCRTSVRRTGDPRQERAVSNSSPQLKALRNLKTTARSAYEEDDGSGEEQLGGDKSLLLLHERCQGAVLGMPTGPQEAVSCSFTDPSNSLMA